MRVPVVELPAQRQPPGEHVVHVYDQDASLVEVVVAFLGPALSRGEAALVVATRLHREMLAVALVESGLPLPALRASRQYVELDAEDTLAQLCGAGRLDGASFGRVIGGLLRSVLAEHGRVHVYGEMVARLWGRGDTATALSLEHHWNDLATVLPFRLCCAYPSRTVDVVGTSEDYAQMLAAHSSSSTDERRAISTWHAGPRPPGGPRAGRSRSGPASGRR